MSYLRTGVGLFLFNTFQGFFDLLGENLEMPAFIGFGCLQSFHVGILRVITLFWELERYSEDNNGILKSRTVFWNPERYSSFWNVILALRMLPGKPRRYSESQNNVLKAGMLPGNPR